MMIEIPNQIIFWSIYINFYRKKFVIENKLPISYRKGKLMHYPESQKVILEAYFKIPFSNLKLKLVHFTLKKKHYFKLFTMLHQSRCNLK